MIDEELDFEEEENFFAVNALLYDSIELNDQKTNDKSSLTSDKVADEAKNKLSDRDSYGVDSQTSPQPTSDAKEVPNDVVIKPVQEVVRRQVPLQSQHKTSLQTKTEDKAKAEKRRQTKDVVNKDKAKLIAKPLNKNLSAKPSPLRTTCELKLSESSSSEEEVLILKVVEKTSKQSPKSKANQSSARSSPQIDPRIKRKQNIISEESDDYRQPKHTKLDKESKYKVNADGFEDKTKKTPLLAKNIKHDISSKEELKVSKEENLKKWIQGSRDVIIPDTSPSTGDKSNDSKKSERNPKEMDKRSAIVHNCSRYDFQTSDQNIEDYASPQTQNKTSQQTKTKDVVNKDKPKQIPKPLNKNLAAKASPLKMNWELKLSQSSSSEEKESDLKVAKKSSKLDPKGKANQLSAGSSPQNKPRIKQKRNKSSEDGYEYRQPKDSHLDKESKTKDNAHGLEDKTKKTPLWPKKTKHDIRSKVKVKVPKPKNWSQSSRDLIIPDTSSSSDGKSGSQSSDDSNTSNRNPKETKRGPAIVHNCSRCDFQTSDRHSLVLHSGKHRNAESESRRPELANVILYGCPLSECKGQQFVAIEAIDEHLKTHIEDISSLNTMSNYKCGVCKIFRSKTVGSMAEHLFQKHRSFKCAFDCDYVASDFKTLEGHSKYSHSKFGQPFECQFCDYCSAVFGSLAQHKARDHAIEWMAAEGDNKCGLCDTSFAYEDDSIVDHLMDHTMDFEMFLECTECGKKCRELSQMKTHLNAEHRVGSANGYKNFISNLKELFTDVLKQKLEKSLAKQSRSSQELFNALAGLESDEFARDDDRDLFEVPNAMTGSSSLFDSNCGHKDQSDSNQEVVPTISIPETGDDQSEKPLVYSIKETEE